MYYLYIHYFLLLDHSKSFIFNREAAVNFRLSCREFNKLSRVILRFMLSKLRQNFYFAQLCVYILEKNANYLVVWLNNLYIFVLPILFLKRKSCFFMFLMFPAAHRGSFKRSTQLFVNLLKYTRTAFFE